MKKNRDDIVGNLLGDRIKEEIENIDNELNMGKYVTTSFTVPEHWRELLMKYFKSRGLNWSSGIRQMMAEYMEEKGLK